MNLSINLQLMDVKVARRHCGGYIYLLVGGAPGWWRLVAPVQPGVTSSSSVLLLPNF